MSELLKEVGSLVTEHSWPAPMNVLGRINLGYISLALATAKPCNRLGPSRFDSAE